jgi:hypothetical protein
MSSELLPILAKAASEQGLLKEVYGDLAKPGVSQVGKALSVVLGLGNTILWPIQLLNEKGRILLERNLNSYLEKLKDTPENQIVPVPTEIGVPLAEKLGHVQDPDLRELYTNLLAKASTQEGQSKAHPSFVNVINNLSPDEAALLTLLRKQPRLPFVTAKWINPTKNHWLQIVDLVFLLPDTIRLEYKNNIVAYMSNLEGLGLIDIRRDIFAIPESVYDPIETLLKDQCKPMTAPPEFPELRLERGRIDVTPFGQLFFAACLPSDSK